MTHRIHRPTALARTLCAAAVCVATLLVATPAQAQPVSNSTLYYRMGGGTPGGGAANRSQVATNLGLSGNLRLNYSCGKFDIGLSWQTLMNGFSQLGTQVTNAVKAGIASLPLYILQRAQPGLYQLFQNYSAKADAIIAASLKTCEEMEATIKAGQNPYEDWVKVAKGDVWKMKAQAGGDVVQAKLDIGRNEEANKLGVQWVFGRRAGGVSSDALRPIRDLSIAGYNATLNKPAASSPTTSYASSAEKNTRLVQAFQTPDEMAKFATEVLGDKRVYTCTQGTDGCPSATNVTTASRLHSRGRFVLPCLALGLGLSGTRLHLRLQCGSIALLVVVLLAVGSGSIVFRGGGVGVAPEHVFTIDGDAVDQQEAALDEGSHFPLAGLATSLTILHVTFVEVRIDVTDTKRDEDVALSSYILPQTIHHFDGFASADPKVEVGVVGLIRVATQGGNAAGKERIGATTSIALGFNPADAVEVTDAVDVQVEVVGLDGSSHGDLQRKKTREITQPSTGPKAEDRETQFPCPGCKENTLELTLGASSCAFRELRRRVLPLGKSRTKANGLHDLCQVLIKQSPNRVLDWLEPCSPKKGSTRRKPKLQCDCNRAQGGKSAGLMSPRRTL